MILVLTSVFSSTLRQYERPFHPDSQVGVQKVQFVPGGATSLGMVARVDIEAGTYLTATCSLKSCDAWDVPGPSRIQGSKNQLGKTGEAGVFLGAGRIPNHDCGDPNCQVCLLSPVSPH